MKTYDTPPAGLEPFDIDKHLTQVNAYVAAHEAAFYKTNAMIGSKVKKSDGVRTSFDIIRVHSLINPECDTTYISLNLTVMGIGLPVSDSHAIAGVLGNELWFSGSGKYCAASTLIEAYAKVMSAASAKLRPILQLFEMFLQYGQHEEGEEWKNGELPEDVKTRIESLLREAGFMPMDDSDED